MSVKKLRKFMSTLGRSDDSQDIWLSEKEAEYKINGLNEKEAKEKAMQDWHTYKGNCDEQT